MNEFLADRERALSIIKGSPTGTTIDCLVIMHHIAPTVVADLIEKRLVAARTTTLAKPALTVTTLFPWRTAA